MHQQKKKKKFKAIDSFVSCVSQCFQYKCIKSKFSQSQTNGVGKKLREPPHECTWEAAPTGNLQGNREGLKKHTGGTIVK